MIMLNEKDADNDNDKDNDKCNYCNTRDPELMTLQHKTRSAFDIDNLELK